MLFGNYTLNTIQYLADMGISLLQTADIHPACVFDIYFLNRLNHFTNTWCLFPYKYIYIYTYIFDRDRLGISSAKTKTKTMQISNDKIKYEEPQSKIIIK